MVFSRLPRRAPELLNGIARRGDAGMHRVDEGAGAPFGNPVQKREAEETSGIRVSFLWILSFGDAQIRLERI